MQQCLQLFCISMLPHYVLTKLTNELDNWVEDGKISTGMSRAFHKEEIADLPHHAQGGFQPVLLRTLGGHIWVADGREFCREYR